MDLAAGDSVHFDAAGPHLYQGLGRRNRAVLLMLHPAPRGMKAERAGGGGAAG